MFAQGTLDDIDLELVPYATIKRFIQSQKEHKVYKFTDIQPSCPDSFSYVGYRKLVYNYSINRRLNDVWDQYLTVDPSQSWNSRIVSFGLLLCKRTGLVGYKNNSHFDKIEEGQVFFLNLNFLAGLVRLPVGFEVLNVDCENKSICFSYIKDGKARGQQVIRFFDSDNGVTHIVHFTAFESDSKFRDKVLYPFFHRRVTNNFHRKMRHVISQSAGECFDLKANAY